LPGPGGRVGKYEICERIGDGGMGVVYRAHDPLLRRDVALKLIREPISGRDEALRTRFISEAQAAARLSHPNIVVLYELGLQGTTPFIAMEYLRGADLKACIEQHWLAGKDEKLQILLRIAQGLEHAHAQGVIHRDVKPANVMILNDGGVKLTDFGLARIVVDDLAESGRIFGTPVYMSPEQLRGHVTGPPSDVFAFGVLAYEVLTGRRPFSGESFGELASRLLFEPPEPFSETEHAALPEALRALVLRCLEKRVEDRYPRFDPLVAEMQRMAAPGTVPVAPSQAAMTAGLGPVRGSESHLEDFTLSGLFEPVPEPELPERATPAPLEILFADSAAALQAGDVCLQPEQQKRRDLALFVLTHEPATLVQAPGAARRIVLQADPTLDDMLAASFLMRRLQGQELPRAAAAFARYAAIAREGMQPGVVPLEASLEGIFLAIRNAAGDDLTLPATAARFLEDWRRMLRVVLGASMAGLDPFTTPLFADGPGFARERAYLVRDHDVYRQDVLRGERWVVRLPDGPPEGSALILARPKSLLWKYWSRQDREAPAGGTYLFLGVTFGPGQWTFSTDPVQRLSLLGLARELQQAEEKHDPARAAADPWFDGAPFGHTLVGAPRGGTRLGQDELLQLVKHWMQARPVASGPPAAGSGD
jgi:hypothetical protein